ncbi:hypothetical protein MWU75_07140 [Ornithinimicrobium sp. F0845]|uniref:hypothetical protein n=1 Tax=Ornithinimicrobium sp. F0845 TaxID=2926412 RepID=UPI001FF2FBE7|nr:hypothetical protein [Ornithinimicrobium sp. F0845]MCK0111909.1 hypothetical protein [Ornithinimicrobium sp. F0845]
MARESAELRGRAKVRPFRVGQLVDLADSAAVRAAIVNLSQVWGGYYTPILDVNQPFDAIEFQARVFDLDSLYLEHDEDDEGSGSSSELFDELLRSGWLWRSLGKYGPFTGEAEDGFRTGVLPTSAVAIEQPPLYIPTWSDTDPMADFYAALFGALQAGEDAWAPTGSQMVGIGALLSRPGLTVDDVGVIQASRVGLSPEPHYDVAWMNGVFVVRPNDPRDLVAFWNMRSFGRPVVPVPAEGGEELLPLLTRGSVPGATSVHGGSERRTERYLGVWQLPNASPATRAAIEAMAGRLGMVVREHRLLEPRHYRFPGIDSRFKSSVRAEFPPTAAHAMVRVPSVPVTAEAHQVMPGTVAVEVDVNTVVGLDPRSVACLPPLRRFGRLQERVAFSHTHDVRVNADGEGVVLGVSARNDEVPVAFVFQLDAIATLLDDDSVKVAQSEDGRFQTRAAQMLGGPAGDLLTQPGIRALIEKAGRSATGLPLQQLRAEILNNRGAWPDKLTAFRTSPAEYADNLVNHLLYSGLFVPMLDVHCSQCRVDMQISPRDLDATIQCEFCGETFRLALSLALSKSHWRFRLAGHLGSEKVKALLPALATSSVLNHLSVRFSAAGPHAFGVEFKFPGRGRMEADIVTWLPYPNFTAAVAEVKNGNWIDGNDVQNLEDLQKRFDRAKVRSVLVFSSLKAALAPEERDVLRALVERATWTSTAIGAQLPRLPLVLTSSDLSVPSNDDNHPVRWEAPGNAGVFATAIESCKRNLGLVDIAPAPEGSATQFVCTWSD